MTRTKAMALLIVVLILSAGFADVEVFVISSDVRANQQGDTHALCAFRRDIKSRYDSGVSFLLTHPHGILGIPLGTIQLSLTNEQHTLAALGGLQCP
jgi:hypothetical protein